ncbi:phage terminase large subunit family protein [Elstera cyanobacteriorum]|uniref:phage terminase large subunit family protein n=1 Tax=Elstera cyanobacteriorum TaxID=2022747 RepID=UPI00235440A7|nr:phage terminase large subunit family protein [Elstera cyanobacteriorum]MCK6444113.1 phage terminase large subunit family protein [Elstera cyanobacteriorum]
MSEAQAFVDAVWRRALAPEPQLTVSEWADRHRVLDAKNAEPGPWRTDRVPYLREVMDCLSASHPAERVVLMAGAQLGKTEAGLNWTGYVIGHAPGTLLLIMPSLDMLRRNSKTRIDPLLSETRQLRPLVVEAKSRESGNTIAQKDFVGGSLIMTGANAPTGLSSTPCRYIFADEVDRYPASADAEGDPVNLAVMRTATFRGRKKIYLVSTPVIAGASRIEKAYLESDQRKYFVPCPHCGEFQVITWGHIVWDEGKPETAAFCCQSCGVLSPEAAKAGMLARGEWRATTPGDGRTVGFHASGLLSPFRTWGDMAVDFLASKDNPALLQVWVNTTLGEPFEDRASGDVDLEALIDRADDWGDDLPPGALAITAGADVQKDRIEVEIVAWGASEESWSLDYEILHGDTAQGEVWAALDRVLLRKYRVPGADHCLTIAAAAVDSGYRTNEVYTFCRSRTARRVWPIKGSPGPGVPPWPRRPPKQRRDTLTPFAIGVDGLKTSTLARLKLLGSGAGRCHFPPRDRDWFAGLALSERPIRKYKKGVPVVEWVRDNSIRNEPLDCRVYATGALHGLYATGYRLETAIGIIDAPKTAPVVIRSKFIGN